MQSNRGHLLKIIFNTDSSSVFVQWPLLIHRPSDMTIPGRNHHPHSMEFEKIQQYLWTTIDPIITIIAEKTNTQEWPHHRLACKQYWSVNPHTRISHVMTMALDGAQPKIEYPVLLYGKNSANTDIGSGRLVKQHHRIIMMTENCSISSSSSSSSWRRYNLFFNGNVIIYLYFLACFFPHSILDS